MAQWVFKLRKLWMAPADQVRRRTHSCRSAEEKPPGDHLPLPGRIIDRRAEEQVLASSTIEADVNVPVDDAPKNVDFQRQ